MFLLVEFIDKKELAVIPDNWLEGTSCAVWPPYISTSRLVKAVTDKEPPLDSWRAYVIRVMYKHGKTFCWKDVLGSVVNFTSFQYYLTL